MIKVPTLSTAKTISGTTMIQRLYHYFERSNYKQSSFYDGNVASLRYLMHMYNDDLDTMELETIKMLTKMYKRFFSNVKIEVSFQKLENEQHLLIVKGSMEENGKTLRLNETSELYKINGLF